MILRKIAVAGLTLLILSAHPSILPLSAQHEKFLGSEDVQKATGLPAVKRIPRSEEVDGDLNFARGDGKVILSISIYPATAYASVRASKTGFQSALQGVGEDAFVGPAGAPPQYILAFRKGAYAVILNTELEGKTSTRLTMDQMIAIARIIASRM